MGAIRFKARSLVDALDGTDTDGGCASLKDLIFDPTTPFTLCCRPAVTELVNTGLGVISVHFELGTRVYGMAASTTFPGFDEPFVYDKASNSLLPITGVSEALLPATPSTTGAWVPPQMSQQGGRVVVTHPGFPGGAGPYIGWFDISAQTLNETGSTQNGLTALVNVADVSGVAPGQTATGTGIPGGTSVVSVTVGPIGPVTTTATTVSGSASITNVGTAANAAAGQPITGTGIPDGTTIVSVTAATGPFSSVGTTVSGSPQVTGFAGVVNAVAGQPITATGIPAGTTISAVISQGSVTNFTATLVNGSTALTNISNAASIPNGAGVSGSGIPTAATISGVVQAPGPFQTTATTISGSPVLTGIANFSGFAVGQAIAGPAVPTGATVIGLSAPTAPVVTSGSLTLNSTTIANLGSGTGLSVGMPVNGSGIQPGSTLVSFTNVPPGTALASITSVSGSTVGVSTTAGMAVGQIVSFNLPPSAGGGFAGDATIVSISGGSKTIHLDQTVSSSLVGGTVSSVNNIATISLPATNTASGVALTFGGQAQVTMSANANASLTGTGIVYGGGSATLSAAATTTNTIVSLAATALGTLLLSAAATASGSPTFTFGGSTIVMSNAATASAAGVSITYAGSTITLSQAMTASAQGITISFTGGTTASPQWGAGNTSGTPLPTPPQAVANFNGRAYYAVNNALYFSDSGFPTQITNATQILIVGDNLPIVALAPLPLTTALQGIVQALIAFKQNLIWQITGDISTGNTTTTSSTGVTTETTQGNLALNTLAIETGTLAPRSICSTPQGVMYMANDGIRLVQPAGTVTPPFKDLRSPFINSTVPSRVAAAANGSLFRICTQNGTINGSPLQDFWLDMAKNGWNGPHSFTYADCGAFENGFVLCSNDQPGILYYSDYQQQSTSVFTELSLQMGFDYQTAPMADSGDAMKAWSVISTANVGLPPKPYLVNYTALDEVGNTLSSCYLASPNAVALWDSAVWDQSLWASAPLQLTPVQLAWSDELVFNRLVIDANGPSSATLRLGSYEIQNEALGYVQ